uniref:Conserved oligomeric Golgi complex subunit 2 n=1 Tax=Steinernema glaseri TaxID=37863 RepID=A0A1I7YTF0_9BILA
MLRHTADSQRGHHRLPVSDGSECAIFPALCVVCLPLIASAGRRRGMNTFRDRFAHVLSAYVRLLTYDSRYLQMATDGKAVPSRTSSFVPTTANDLQLSFNKAHFSRPDFDLERFLSLTRRRVTLDQLYADLKVYLKVVQNSMIELINDDYADFVNLSSNLVSLKESIDKIGSEISGNFAELHSSTVDIQKTAHFVEGKFQELTGNHRAQSKIRGRISLVVALKSLLDALAKKPVEINRRWLDSLTYSVVSFEIWYGRNEDIDERVSEARERCMSRVETYLSQFIADVLKNDANYLPEMLSIILLIKRTDGPTKVIGSSVINPLMLVKDGLNLDQLLDKSLKVLTELQTKWTGMLEKNGYSSDVVLSFLDHCLLMYLSDFLDLNFGAVLIPSDNRLFHRCFTLITDFIRAFRKFPSTIPLLRRIRDKFNLIVYFKLETQHFISTLNSQTAVDQFSYSLDDGDRLTPPSRSIFAAVKNSFSDEVFLPSLIDKFWDFTLKIYCKYGEWVDTMTRHFSEAKATDVNGDSCAWKCVTALAGDVTKFEEDIFGHCTTVIYTRVNDLHLSTTALGQCITLFCNQLSSKRKELDDILMKMVREHFDKQLDGVLEIPRQYRWTKKPAPSECSSYLSGALDFLDEFQQFAIRATWSETVSKGILTTVLEDTMANFCTKAEQVLESVEQTGSSLQRFKRKAKVTATGEEMPQSSSTSNLESDEGKIRAQLRLDIEFFCKKATEYDLNNNIETFDKLLSRLS